MRRRLTAEQCTTRQRYRVPGIALPSRRTGATTKRYSSNQAKPVLIPRQAFIAGFGLHPSAHEKHRQRPDIISFEEGEG